MIFYLKKVGYGKMWNAADKWQNTYAEWG